MIVVLLLSRKRTRVVLIVATRQTDGRVDCRLGRGSAEAAFAFEGGTAAVALDVHLEDRGVVDQAIDDGQRHRLVGEDLSPFAERLVGGDEERSPFVAGADEFEKHAGFGLVLGDVGDVIEDQQMEFVELGNGGFESELAAGNLQSD